MLLLGGRQAVGGKLGTGARAGTHIHSQIHAKHLQKATKGGGGGGEKEKELQEEDIEAILAEVRQGEERGKGGLGRERHISEAVSTHRNSIVFLPYHLRSAPRTQPRRQ